MTTTYYTFQTRKVKVSGGHDLLSLVPVAHAEPAKALEARSLPAAQDTKAEILDINVCRRHMETRNAWKSLTQAAQSSEEDLLDQRWEAVDRPEVEEAQPARSFQASDRLELIATGAVILTALSAAAAFLSLL